MNCEHILDKSKFNKYYTLRKEIAPKGSFLDQLKCNEISVSTPCHSVGLPLLHLGPSACTCFAASPHASWKSISRFEGGVAPVARRWSPPNELAGSSSPSSLDCSSCCAGLFLIFLFFPLPQASSQYVFFLCRHMWFLRLRRRFCSFRCLFRRRFCFFRCLFRRRFRFFRPANQNHIAIQ
jgi:hypothetical protein